MSTDFWPMSSATRARRRGDAPFPARGVAAAVAVAREPVAAALPAMRDLAPPAGAPVVVQEQRRRHDDAAMALAPLVEQPAGRALVARVELAGGQVRDRRIDRDRSQAARRGLEADVGAVAVEAGDVRAEAQPRGP